MHFVPHLPFLTDKAIVGLLKSILWSLLNYLFKILRRHWDKWGSGWFRGAKKGIFEAADRHNCQAFHAWWKRKPQELHLENGTRHIIVADAKKTLLCGSYVWNFVWNHYWFPIIDSLAQIGHVTRQSMPAKPEKGIYLKFLEVMLVWSKHKWTPGVWHGICMGEKSLLLKNPSLVRCPLGQKEWNGWISNNR